MYADDRILTAKLALFVALSLIRFVGESMSLQVPEKINYQHPDVDSDPEGIRAQLGGGEMERFGFEPFGEEAPRGFRVQYVLCYPLSWHFSSTRRRRKDGKW